jgi:phage baseplate assembly protein V
MSDIFMEQAGGYGGISAGQLVNGVLTATVTNTKDPEKLGRIKVQFLGQGTDNETDWIRVAAFAAGSSKGAFFLPEVGEEVLVAFIQGSVDRPVVIGALWEKTDKPPEDNADGKNNIKMLKTRAGHTVTFDDDTQTKKAKIEIKSSAGHIITLDDAAGKEKIEIKDKSGSNKIIIDTVQKAITIESGMKLDIKANMITIEAKSTLTLKSAMLKSESSGIAEIKGAMVKIN